MDLIHVITEDGSKKLSKLTAAIREKVWSVASKTAIEEGRTYISECDVEDAAATLDLEALISTDGRNLEICQTDSGQGIFAETIVMKQGNRSHQIPSLQQKHDSPPPQRRRKSK